MQTKFKKASFSTAATFGKEKSGRHGEAATDVKSQGMNLPAGQKENSDPCKEK